MIAEGYAWEYDGGTKKKNFEELREIRRSLGTLVEEPEEGDPLPEVGHGTTTSSMAGLY